jgi:hypothetical protein
MDIIEQLLSHPRMSADFSSLPSDLQPLTIAVEENNLPLLRRLLRDSRLIDGSVVSKALFKAADLGHTEIIEFYLRLLSSQTKEKHNSHSKHESRYENNSQSKHEPRSKYELLSKYESHCEQNLEAIRFPRSFWIALAKKESSSLFRWALEDPQIDTTTIDWQVLFTAVEYNQVEIFSVLLESSQIDFSTCCNDGLLRAIKDGHKKIVDLWLQDKRLNPLLKRQYDHRDLLQVAIKHHQVDIFRLLLQDPRIRNSTNLYGLFLRLRYKEDKTEKSQLMRVLLSQMDFAGKDMI